MRMEKHGYELAERSVQDNSFYSDPNFKIDHYRKLYQKAQVSF